MLGEDVLSCTPTVGSASVPSSGTRATLAAPILTLPLEPLATDSRFEDQGEIGRGGKGVVHRVFDRQLHRRLAMKIARDNSPEAVAPFVEEAQISSQLDHPNIVPVHDLGVSADRAYITMKWVRGKTFTSILEELHDKQIKARDLEKVVEVVLRVCDAVSFAHSRGVIHRDLKPDNVMVGTHGQVYVMDWGVALVRDGPEFPAREDRVTLSSPPAARSGYQFGRGIGTPAYMAPEQVTGGPSNIDERSDVYGIGGILYELITGLAPNLGRRPPGAPDTARQLRSPQECSLLPQTPPELCRITMKALAQDVAERYPSVDALKSDLEEFLRGGTWFETRVFDPDTEIVREGDPAEDAYIIVDGHCAVYKQSLLVRHMGPGDVFGETAIFMSGARTATVVAVDRVTVKVVTRESFDRELGRSSWLGGFVKALAERFVDVDQKLAESRRVGG